MNLLMIGDVVGRPGRHCLRDLLPEIIKRYQVDFTIANCENIAGGKGVTQKTISQMFDYGVNVATSGNHVWDKKEVYHFIEAEENFIRPANYPPGTPGKGYGIFEINGINIGVINLAGRVFMPDLDCPFRKARAIIDTIKHECKFILVDFHAEATSEKIALAHYLNGEITVFVGTHTHVQTADEQILSGGTGFLTDVGMTGPCNSVLGVEKRQVIEGFLTQLPGKLEVADKDNEVQFNGVLMNLSEYDGTCHEIERIQATHKF